MPQRLFTWIALAAASGACSSTAVGPSDAGFADARPAADALPAEDAEPAPDSGPFDGGPDAGRLFGFIFTGPADGGASTFGSSWRLLLATGGSTRTATIGTPCIAGDDCAAIGPGAGCFRAADRGFCSRNCPPESDFCWPGATCVRGLYHGADGNDSGLCLPLCEGGAQCDPGGILSQCSGPFVSFHPDLPRLSGKICFPECSKDEDCNSDESFRFCNPRTRRCVSPDYELGRSCTADEDCRGVGPGGSCMRSTRSPNDGYCTIACERDFATTECIGGYATRPDGSDALVRLKSCSGEAVCQADSSNTCNYFPSEQSSYCSIRCSSNADCPSGACNVATGDCQQADFWATECASSSNCATGLCIADFHRPGHNCTRPCAVDDDCGAGAICIRSPVAVLGDQGHYEDGFCAPSCTPGGAPCADPSTRCLMPSPQPEIDFAGSASGSGPFCWR